MARLRRPGEDMSVADLGAVLTRELPLPDPRQHLDEWHTVMHRRRHRGAELGFDLVDVIRAGLCERLGPAYQGFEACRPAGKGRALVTEGSDSPAPRREGH